MKYIPDLPLPRTKVEKPEECEHDNLQFGSGDFYIFCHDCGRTWATLNFTRTAISPEDANLYQGIRTDPFRVKRQRIE